MQARIIIDIEANGEDEEHFSLWISSRGVTYTPPARLEVLRMNVDVAPKAISASKLTRSTQHNPGELDVDTMENPQ